MTLKLPLLLTILGSAAVLGLVAGLTMDKTESPPTIPVGSNEIETAPAAAPRNVVAIDDEALTRITALERRLQEEIDARRALQHRLEEMDRQLSAFGGVDNSGASEQPELAEPDQANDEPAWFDENALLESGIAASQANELKLFFEQLELERLQLRDRSVREGWERGRLGDELRLLDDRERELKDSLGESAYDAYLYASGQPNRVAVTSVLASAQAAQAGIQPGDLILRYDNERIYSWRDLRTATTSGNLSDTIEVEVERDGDTLRFYLARGPLGIRMDSRSVAP